MSGKYGDEHGRGSDKARSWSNGREHLSAYRQPRFDEKVVPRATIDDLHPELLDRYLADLRRVRPQTDYVHGDWRGSLERLHVVARDAAMLRPTLAGLLVFGKYPQEFFPQLMITFQHFFGTTREEKTPQGECFLENRRFEGPIPAMIQEAEIFVLASLRKASLIERLVGRDITEYPPKALREALVNAVAHRDYSSDMHGSCIQVRLFADRIEVQSPGSLFGSVTIGNLAAEHTTRNARLMRLLEGVHVVESRGSGIRNLLQAMRDADLEPPRFDARRTGFLVTLRNQTVMSPASVTWLNQFAALRLNDRQRLALVYVRRHKRITNADYRRLNHVNALAAAADLRALVQLAMVTQHGTRRWTYYKLAVPDEMASVPTGRMNEEHRILRFVRLNGAITNGECKILLDVGATRAYYLLDTLTRSGKLRAEGSKKGRRYLLP